jgi:hypothetical protein
VSYDVLRSKHLSRWKGQIQRPSHLLQGIEVNDTALVDLHHISGLGVAERTKSRTGAYDTLDLLFRITIFRPNPHQYDLAPIVYCGFD